MRRERDVRVSPAAHDEHAMSLPPQDSGSNKLVDSALRYARRGWPAFPLHSIRQGRCTCQRPDCQTLGKHPCTSHGVKDATTDAATIRSWWVRWPEANVGIATGAVSGVIVLDVDPRHGGDDTLADLERRHGRLPETPRVITGANGLHVYFTIDQALCNRVAFARGLDFRGDGGYVVAPPSLHASGRRYIWDSTAIPGGVTLVAMPAWLADLVAEPAGDRLCHHGTPLVIRGGERNWRLFQLACVQRRYGLNAKAIRAYLERQREHVQPQLGPRTGEDRR